jgi:acetyl-CoA decarbonylase/synthase complex subunit gamma
MEKFEFPMMQEGRGCGCGVPETPSGGDIATLDQAFVEGQIATPAGVVAQVSSGLRFRDRWGTVRARFGVGRMDYSINPGLYALGRPDENAPVFVSANYKMSFDCLRAAVPGRSAWILVLDTKGINVWCAAGKGTFGTEELIKRIEATGLSKVVTHRKLILPQLGAPGVSAHRVKQASGFRVQYGPVRAGDLPAYLEAGGRATQQMRTVDFPLKDRAVLIPIELIEALKPFLLTAPVLFLLAGLVGPAGFWVNATNQGLFAILAFLCAIVSGAVLNPILLPYLPGRAFSLKGLSVGLAMALVLIALRGMDLGAWSGKIEALAWLLIVPAVSAYLAMNFTGCSTYTSLSGVKREMRFALPLEIASGASGLLLWIGALWMA